jgi:hypothetical protein
MSDFNAKDSLSRKSKSTIVSYLKSIGDEEAAHRVLGQGGSGQGLKKLWGADQYLYSGLSLGFLDASAQGDLVDLASASSLTADSSLKGSRLKITLDQIYVQSFPGLGSHKILCEFVGKNQIAEESEELRFAINVKVNDKSSGAVTGLPIFMGVSVGDNGIDFGGRTVNVSSSTDDVLLEALQSDALKSGLLLLNSVQPALKPFVGLAQSVVKSVVSRAQNHEVYSFKLGLDFGGSATSARLRLGSYFVVQSDEDRWDWSKIAWDRGAHRLVNKIDRTPVEFNYLIIGVSPYV